MSLFFCPPPYFHYSNCPSPPQYLFATPSITNLFPIFLKVGFGFHLLFIKKVFFCNSEGPFYHGKIVVFEKDRFNNSSTTVSAHSWYFTLQKLKDNLKKTHMD